MKIFYFGRRIDGRFDSFKAFVRRVWFWTKVSALVSLFASLCIGFGAVGLSTSTVSATVVDSMPAKLDELKEDVVNRLMACETSHYDEDDGIIIFDTNNRASIGQLQFQKATVQHYYNVLYGQVISSKEAVLIALDTEKAKALATDIIFKTNNDAKDWLNCSNKLGLGPEIRAIKKLSK